MNAQNFDVIAKFPKMGVFKSPHIAFLDDSFLTSKYSDSQKCRARQSGAIAIASLLFPPFPGSYVQCSCQGTGVWQRHRALASGAIAEPNPLTPISRHNHQHTV